MIRNDFINSLAIELCQVLDVPDKFHTVRNYIRMAVVGASECYGRNGKEIAQCTKDGTILRTFKDISAASRLTGFTRSNIIEQMEQKRYRHTVHGYVFKRIKNTL